MNKKNLLALTVFLISMTFLSANVFSQNEKAQKTPEEIATKIAGKMKDKLSLTDDQYNKVYSIALSGAQDHVTNKEKYKSMDKEARKQLRQEKMQNYKTQLQGILNADQMQKFDEFIAKHKDHKGGKHKKDQLPTK